MRSDAPRVAVTGAAGFVGFNVLEQLLTFGIDAVAIDVAELPATARADFAASPVRSTRL